MAANELWVISSLKWVFAGAAMVVEPQIGGIFGSLSYIMARHELNMEKLSTRSKIVVLFWGWMGAWAVVNMLGEYQSDMPHVLVHIAASVVGFFMYDTMLAFGKNTNSVIGFFAHIMKGIIEKRTDKWKQ